MQQHSELFKNESPELKYAKRRLYENLIMANLTKIYVLFKTSFWLEEGFSGEVVSNGGPSLVGSAIVGSDLGSTFALVSPEICEGAAVLSMG